MYSMHYNQDLVYDAANLIWCIVDVYDMALIIDVFKW